MEWDVKTVDVYPTKADHSDVIYMVHWRVTKTEVKIMQLQVMVLKT